MVSRFFLIEPFQVIQYKYIFIQDLAQIFEELTAQDQHQVIFNPPADKKK